MEDNKQQQKIDYCDGCSTSWVTTLGLEKCTYCDKPVKTIGWVEQ